MVAGLEAKYRASTGVPSLKIRHNNMIGYHIEVTATHADKLDLPGGARFDREKKEALLVSGFSPAIFPSTTCRTATRSPPSSPNR